MFILPALLSFLPLVRYVVIKTLDSADDVIKEISDVKKQKLKS